MPATNPCVAAPDRGAIYTPEHLAEWVAHQILAALPEGPTTLVDLACGRGALLDAARACRPGVRPIGVDIDPDDLRIASHVLPTARLLQADALMPAGDIASLSEIPPRLGLIERVDGVILNPPWGVDVGHSRSLLRRAGYTLARGQFDSASLFMELGLSVLRSGGVAGFIIPDSFFFPDYAAVRRHLLSNSELIMVARLGEGFFPGVYRGTAVVILRKGAPDRGHRVRCFQLDTSDRRAVLSGKRTLEDSCTARSHEVAQTRFATNIDARLEIAVRKVDTPFMSAMTSIASDWRRWFDSGRGVELSKTGEVVTCRRCGAAHPRPRSPRRVSCSKCEEVADSSTMKRETIVRTLSGAGAPWAPLIVGEDVGRYDCRPSREIVTGMAGISYKDTDTHTGKRLLVRKTGMGLRAALVEADAYTTQVVFHYRTKQSTPDFLLPYALGLLCSRAMLAFHLLSSGEMSWRSHPYVTQRVLSHLPVPDPQLGNGVAEMASAIAQRVTAISEKYDHVLDLEIEALAASAFGLNRRMISTVARVLDRSQPLQGIEELRFDPDEVTSRL
jgi:adenine-specific DNA-methyltransferase